MSAPMRNDAGGAMSRESIPTQPIFTTEVMDGIAVITMDVPGAAVNTLSRAVREEFGPVMERLERDTSIRGAVLISGKPDGFIAGADIDELLNAPSADALTALAKNGHAMLGRLDTSFTQQTRFISDAAHELRTPVSVMLTQTQMALRRERPAEEYRQSLQACERAATRMRQLIESLLATPGSMPGTSP